MSVQPQDRMNVAEVAATDAPHRIVASGRLLLDPPGPSLSVEALFADP